MLLTTALTQMAQEKQNGRRTPDSYHSSPIQRTPGVSLSQGTSSLSTLKRRISGTNSGSTGHTVIMRPLARGPALKRKGNISYLLKTLNLKGMAFPSHTYPNHVHKIFSCKNSIILPQSSVRGDKPLWHSLRMLKKNFSVNF